MWMQFSLEGWRVCVDHFASDAHRKKVEAFCRHHRCDVDRRVRATLQLAPGKQRQVRIFHGLLALHSYLLMLSAAIEYGQLVKAFIELQQQEAHSKAEEQAQAQAAPTSTTRGLLEASAVRAEAFLSSAAARLQVRQ